MLISGKNNSAPRHSYDGKSNVVGQTHRSPCSPGIDDRGQCLDTILPIQKELGFHQLQGDGVFYPAYLDDSKALRTRSLISQASTELMKTLRVIEATTARVPLADNLFGQDGVKSLCGSTEIPVGTVYTNDNASEVQDDQTNYNFKALCKRKGKIDKVMRSNPGTRLYRTGTLRNYRDQRVNRQLRNNCYQQAFQALPIMIRCVPEPLRKKIIASTKERALKLAAKFLRSWCNWIPPVATIWWGNCSAPDLVTSDFCRIAL